MGEDLEPPTPPVPSFLEGSDYEWFSDDGTFTSSQWLDSKTGFPFSVSAVAASVKPANKSVHLETAYVQAKMPYTEWTSLSFFCCFMPLSIKSGTHSMIGVFDMGGGFGANTFFALGSNSNNRGLDIGGTYSVMNASTGNITGWQTITNSRALVLNQPNYAGFSISKEGNLLLWLNGVVIAEKSSDSTVKQMATKPTTKYGGTYSSINFSICGNSDVSSIDFFNDYTTPWASVDYWACAVNRNTYWDASDFSAFQALLQARFGI